MFRRKKIDLSSKMISFIESEWKEHSNVKFPFVQRYFINFVKLKFDYIIFEKKLF